MTCSVAPQALVPLVIAGLGLFLAGSAWQQRNTRPGLALFFAELLWATYFVGGVLTVSITNPVALKAAIACASGAAIVLAYVLTRTRVPTHRRGLAYEFRQPAIVIDDITDERRRSAAVHHLELEGALRGALERNELTVVYQPIVRLEGGRTEEVEALVRWQPDEGVSVPLAQFIPVAEETGLILPIGAWVLEPACRAVVSLQQSIPGAEHLVASVNVSGRRFQHPRLVEKIMATLERTGLNPQHLKLEITETVLMQDCEIAAQTLRTLRALGIRLAIDDFGTGYSSLSYLKRFPVHTLKVDRSFVIGIGEDQRDATIVQGVLALANALGLEVTAEGIESHAQWARLRVLGCDRGQGYYFAPPMPVEELHAFLRRISWPPSCKAA